MEILSIKNVGLIYQTPEKETFALKDVSMSVNKNEFVSVIGPSGCGKTTVLSIIAGLIAPSSGEVILNGKKIEGISQDIGYMLQKDQLFEWRTIKSNILLGLEVQKKLNKETEEYALSLAEKYGLKDFLNSYPNQLSGGMRQRAALIRTLAFHPTLLLLDEPFSALDYQTRLEVCDDVHNIIKSEGKTAVLVTHDISEAISLSNRIVVLSARPASVKNIYNIDIELPPLRRREDARFPKWFDTIWKDIQESTKKTDNQI